MIVSSPKQQRNAIKLKHGTFRSLQLLLSFCVAANVALVFLLLANQVPKSPDGEVFSIPIAYLDPLTIETHRLATFRAMQQDYCEYPRYDKKQEGQIPIIFRSEHSTPANGQQSSPVSGIGDHQFARRRLSAEISALKSESNAIIAGGKNITRLHLGKTPAGSTVASGLKLSAETSSVKSVCNSTTFAGSKNITFLHLGKTSGSTVASGLKVAYLPFKNYWLDDCPLFDKATMLSESVTDLLHGGEILQEMADTTKYNYSNFLFSVRHPVYRIQSWFDYENHFFDDRIYCGKAMLYSCYMRFDQLATVGLSGARPDPLVYKVAADLSQDECSHWAWGAIQGNASAVRHNFFNYERYTRAMFTIEDREIFVIRSEHTWDDWRTIDLMLGGNGELPFTAGKLKKTNVNPYSDKGISKAGLDNVCRALCDEIQIYKRLLVEAVNLNDDDRRQSLEELRRVCPLETSLSTRVCSYNN